MKTIDMETLKEVISNIGKSTNPTEFCGNEKFIQYMDTPDVMGFGQWMQANGYNLAFIALKVELNKRGFDI